MARRKQREPRRSSAYTPELKIQSAVFSNKQPDVRRFSLALRDGESVCEEEDVPLMFHNSSLNNQTNPDAECASWLSDGGSDLKEENEEDASSRPGKANDILENLARMKDVYANLIPDASWSATQSGADVVADANTNDVNERKCLNGNVGGASVAYDWHRAALAKTLRHAPYHGPAEPALFSTVQLYRQSNKLYGPVFTGASKFRCRECNAAYDALVDLTVHMNRTGHYRDDNADKEGDRGDAKRWSKPRKRSLLEMEGKEEAQKVLKCMYCGHSFESLQDLSVHMIKTKHYQKVPLKAPMPDLPGTSLSVEAGKDMKGLPTPNNRYQNGAGYSYQFESRKAQILKRVECGSPHNSLQQLAAHVTLAGHFLKVCGASTKKANQPVQDKTRSLSTQLPANDTKEERTDDAGPVETTIRDVDCWRYLREEEPEKKPDRGMDILRSLENAVSSAISKAQAWSPTWGGGNARLSVNPGFDTSVSSDPGSVTTEANVDARVLVKKENTIKVEELDGDVCKLGPATDCLGLGNGLSPETSFISPFSSLRSVTKPRLNAASKSSNPSLEPLLTLYQISNIKMDQAAEQNKLRSFINDQPIDLRTSRTRKDDESSLNLTRDDPEGTELRHMTSPFSDPASNTVGSEKSDSDGTSRGGFSDDLQKQTSWNSKRLLLASSHA